MDGIRAFIDALKRDKARRRRLAGVVCVLAMFVAGGVFWRLRIIGLTKTVDPLCGVLEHIHTEACIAERILICGYPDEEVLPEPLPDAVQLPVLNPELQPEPLYSSCLNMIHQHDAGCYDIENNLICGRADFVIHTHDSFCFDENGALVCPLNEVFEHIHGEECYTQSDITVCGLAEGEEVVVHIHGDACYSEDGTLICELPESEPHLHNELCYGRDLICEIEEISEHIHSEECFDENGVRICEKTEILVHQHSDECRNTAGVDSPLPPFIDIDNPIDITNPIDPSIGELQPVIGVGDAVMQTGFDFMGISPVFDGINELENVEAGDVPAMPIEENSEPLPEGAESDMPTDTEVEDIATETENGEPLEDLPSENESENGEDDGNLPSENVIDSELETPPETDFFAEAAESAPHVHTDECYLIVYDCGFEEHTHTISCYADINADRDVAEEYRMRAESVELSGEYADDVVSIARSQLGYTESKQNFILDQNGLRKGYNLYSDWYTGGDGAYTDWNATFAAFCLEKAGIDREELLFNSGVHAWTVDLEKEWLLIRDTENAKFGPGDIVFFDTDSDGRADRVGICITPSGDEDIFYTIEGDTPVTEQVVSEENSNMTALGFDGTAAFEDFDAETETVFGEREILYAEQSYVWDDDKIETHAVAEVMHSYSDGDIVGYVKLSAESEVEMYADIAGGYKQYEGDYDDLEGNGPYVVVNASSNKALTFGGAPVLAGVGASFENTTTNYSVSSLNRGAAYTAHQADGTKYKWQIKKTDWNSTVYLIYCTIDGKDWYLAQKNSNSNSFVLTGKDENWNNNADGVNPNFKCENVSEHLRTNDAGNTEKIVSVRLRPFNSSGQYVSISNNGITLTNTPTDLIITTGHPYWESWHSDTPQTDTLPEGPYYIMQSDTYNVLAYSENTPSSKRLANYQNYTKWTLIRDTQDWGAQGIQYVYYLKSGDKYLRLPLDSSNNALAQEIGTEAYGLAISAATNGYNVKSYAYARNNLHWNGSTFVPDDNGDKNSSVYTVNFYNAQTGDLVSPVNGQEGELGTIGEYVLVINDNVVVSIDEPTNANVIDVNFDGIDVDDKLLWKFPQVVDSNDPNKFDKLDYRFENKTGPYLHIVEDMSAAIESARMTSAADGYQAGASKLRFIPHQNGFLIMSMNGDGGDTRYYLVRNADGSGYSWREFTSIDDNNKNPDNLDGNIKNEIANAGGLFKLYYQPEIPEIAVDHIYQISTGGAPPTIQETPVDIVLREGEVVRLDALSYGYQNGNITIVGADDVVDCSYYRYEKTSDNNNPDHSEYILEALHTGKVQIQIKSEDGNATVYVNVTVVPNNDNDVGYYAAIKDTFQGYDYDEESNKSKRYHHLDVEIEANFDINVYRPDGSVHKIEPDPGSIRVTKVYATVYNTASLLEGDAKATWHESYLRNTDGANNEQTADVAGRHLAPRGNYDHLYMSYVNPIPDDYQSFVYKEEKDEGGNVIRTPITINTSSIDWLKDGSGGTNKMYMTNGALDESKVFKDYEFIDVNTVHYSNDCFPDGGDVLSYTVEYNPGKTQANGQYEFLTNGWGWLELYDGDTAILHCTVEYDYNGTTYTVEKDVTRVICDTTNICPSGYSDSHPIQGFDIDVFFDDIDEFESTEFTKVDQYGDTISGAEFAFYRADANYNYWGEPLIKEETDEDGVFHFTYNDVIKSLTDENEITSIIGDKRPGDAEYNDAPLTMAQLCKFLGKNFVMVETKIPDGYHKVGDQINMCFLGDTDLSSDVVQSSGNLFLVCDNTLDSGVYTDPNAFMVAPEGGRLARADNNGTIQYVNNDSNNSANGRLFAVVAKRNGVNSGAADYRYMDYDHWDIVYGNDYEGYFYIGEGHGTEARKGVAELLKMRASGELPENEGIYEFTQDQFERNRYTVSARNLPGDIKRYVNYIVENTATLSQNDLDNLEYAVLYYYLPNSANVDIKTATANQIANSLVRVTNISNGNGENTKFDVNWSSTVKIPNIENRLFFQKRDSDGNLLNDAGFALYHSGDPEERERSIVVNALNDDAEYANANIFTDAYYTDRQNGKIHYYLGDITDYYQETGDDKNWSAVGKAIIVGADGTPRKGEFRLDYSFWSANMERGYVTKPNAGRIQFVYEDGTGAGSISPATKPNINGVRSPYVGYTHGGSTENGELTDECSVVAEAGTGHFGRISNGKYILREIKPPSGFNVNNDAQTLVLVNDSGVFANAGKPYDSVSVANGAGYLVATLNSFASRGTIDESLRWIYTAMRVNDKTTFAGFAGGTGESEVKAPYKWPYAVPSGLTYVAPSGFEIPLNGWAKYPYLEDGTPVNDARTNNLSEALVTYLEYQTEYIDKDDNPNKDEILLESPKALFDYETNNHLEEEDFRKFYGGVDGSEYLNEALIQAARNKGKYPALEFKAGDTIQYTDKDGNPQHYTFNKDAILHGYEARKNFAGDIDTAEGAKTLRLLTDSGWSSLSVYQDFQWAQTYYAKQEDTDKNTSYRVLTSDAGPRELTHLYSNSTFVVVVDNVSLYLNVIKRGDTNGSGVIDGNDSYLTGAEFVLYYEENDPDSGKVVRQYYTYDEATKAVGVVEYADGYTENDTLYPKAYRFTTNEKGAMQIRFAREGTYYLEEVNAPEPYGLIDTLMIEVKLVKPSDNPNAEGALATITISDPNSGETHYTAQVVTENNEYSQYYIAGATPAQYAIEILDPKNYRLEIEKIDKNGSKPLAGAQFRVYKLLEDETKLYYDEYTVKGITTTEDVEKAQIFTTALNEDGSRAYIPIHGLANEEVVYYIEEVNPPNGYSTLPGVIKVDFTRRTNDADKLPTVTLDGKKSDYIGLVTAIRSDIDEDGDGTVDTNVIVGYKFTVANESGFELPETGSSGELIYTLFGMTLMILPIVYIYVRRRRERRAAK